MKKQEFAMALYHAQKFWLDDDPGFDRAMDDLAVHCTPEQWFTVSRLFEFLAAGAYAMRNEQQPTEAL